MLILAISVICFQIKNKDMIEEFQYSTFENCTRFIKQKSDQKIHLEFAKQLDKKISEKQIFNDDVSELKLECSKIVSEIGDKLISERVIIYKYNL